MATEFERTKRDVLGHSVVITSWFGGDIEGWHASAPRYAIVGKLSPMSDRERHGSRQAAVEQVVHVLAGHFDEEVDPTGDKMIFL